MAPLVLNSDENVDSSWNYDVIENNRILPFIGLFCLSGNTPTAMCNKTNNFLFVVRT